MITEVGRVVAVEKDCLWVETIRKTTCNSCSVQQGCGHGLMNKMDSARHNNGRLNHVRALLQEHSPESFSVDDMVRISISEHLLVKGALLVYILPLLLMLLGGGAASYFMAGDIVAFAGCIMGLVLGFIFVRGHAYWTRNDVESQPIVLSREGIDHIQSVSLTRSAL